MAACTSTDISCSTYTTSTTHVYIVSRAQGTCFSIPTFVQHPLLQPPLCDKGKCRGHPTRRKHDQANHADAARAGLVVPLGSHRSRHLPRRQQMLITQRPSQSRCLLTREKLGAPVPLHGASRPDESGKPHGAGPRSHRVCSLRPLLILEILADGPGFGEGSEGLSHLPIAYFAIPLS